MNLPLFTFRIMILETTQSGRPKLPTAKWGAACAPCATAKAKCIRSNSTEGSKCDRFVYDGLRKTSWAG